MKQAHNVGGILTFTRMILAIGLFNTGKMIEPTKAGPDGAR